jgi:ribonucleotide monophosphatase NagD (HAD superfamily)
MIVGKPSPFMVQTALDVMGLTPDDCILIGDRLETDIKMGKEAGIATGIVLTGVTDEKTLKTSSIHPDFIFSSIADLKDLMVWR